MLKPLPVEQQVSFPTDSQITAEEKLEAVSSASAKRTIFKTIDDQIVIAFGIILGIIALSYFVIVVYKGYERYMLRSRSRGQ